MTLLVNTFDFSKIDNQFNTSNLNASDIFKHAQPVWFVDNKVMSGPTELLPMITNDIITKIISLYDGYATISCDDTKYIDVFIAFVKEVFDCMVDTHEKYFHRKLCIMLRKVFNAVYDDFYSCKSIQKGMFVTGFIYYDGLVYSIQLADTIENSYINKLDPIGVVQNTTITCGVNNAICEKLILSKVACINFDEPNKYIKTIEKLVIDEIHINSYTGLPLYKVTFPSYVEYLHNERRIDVDVFDFSHESNEINIVNTFELDKNRCMVDTYTGYLNIYNEQ